MIPESSFIFFLLFLHPLLSVSRFLHENILSFDVGFLFLKFNCQIFVCVCVIRVCVFVYISFLIHIYLGYFHFHNISVFVCVCVYDSCVGVCKFAINKCMKIKLGNKNISVKGKNTQSSEADREKSTFYE